MISRIRFLLISSLLPQNWLYSKDGFLLTTELYGAKNNYLLTTLKEATVSIFIL